MGHPQAPIPPHFYSQELQLKLYQAFIFSIPILFSIILFLLFYLFYLKKRTSTTSSPTSSTPPETANQVRLSSSTGLKRVIKEKLLVILFDEDAKARETLCCVCLGEFNIKEELHLLPSCKHFFHTDCIRLWLHSNSTCPLCRCSVIISSAKSISYSEANESGNNQQQELPSIEGSSGSESSLGSENRLNLRSESVVINIQTLDT